MSTCCHWFTIIPYRNVRPTRSTVDAYPHTSGTARQSSRTRGNRTWAPRRDPHTPTVRSAVRTCRKQREPLMFHWTVQCDALYSLGRIRDGRHAVCTLHVRVDFLQQRVRRRANVAGLVIELLRAVKCGCVRGIYRLVFVSRLCWLGAWHT